MEIPLSLHKENPERFTETCSISHQIGKGSFGTIRKVSPIDGPEQSFAAKVVPVLESDLKKETMILQSLKSEPEFPKVQDYFTESRNEILVMSFLGSNLDCLQKQCQGKFSLKTVILLALQSLRRIEALHKQGIGISNRKI